MKSFSILLGIEKCILKNKIRMIISNPKRFITYLVYIIFMGSMLLLNAKNFENIGKENFGKYGVIGMSLMIFFMFISLTKKSTFAFKMSEINMIFTAPIDERKVLLFALLKRIPTSLFTALFSLMFLIAMAIGALQPSFLEIAVTCIGYSLIILLIEPLGFCMYTIAMRRKKTETSQYPMIALLIIAAAVMLAFAGLEVINNGFSVESISKGLNHPVTNWIPIIGWGKALSIVTITGITGQTYIYLGLLLLTYVVLFITTYRLGVDYYEDVIETSELRAELVKKAKRGKQFDGKMLLRKKKVELKDKYKGAGAIFWKKQLVTIKTSISVFFTFESVLALIMGIGSGLFLKDEPTVGVIVMGAVYLYIKFLFSFNTELDKELNRHYFYTIPDSAMKKLFYVTHLDVLRYFINSVILVVINLVITQNIDVAYVVIPFTFTSFYFIIVVSSFVLKLFFNVEDYERLLVLFKMIQNIVIMLPALVTTIAIGVITKSVLYALIGGLVVNSIIGIVFLALGDTVLSRLELK